MSTKALLAVASAAILFNFANAQTPTPTYAWKCIQSNIGYASDFAANDNVGSFTFVDCGNAAAPTSLQNGFQCNFQTCTETSPNIWQSTIPDLVIDITPTAVNAAQTRRVICLQTTTTAGPNPTVSFTVAPNEASCTLTKPPEYLDTAAAIDACKPVVCGQATVACYNTVATLPELPVTTPLTSGEIPVKVLELAQITPSVKPNLVSLLAFDDQCTVQCTSLQCGDGELTVETEPDIYATTAYSTGDGQCVRKITFGGVDRYLAAQECTALPLVPVDQCTQADLDAIAKEGPGLGCQPYPDWVCTYPGQVEPFTDAYAAIPPNTSNISELQETLIQTERAAPNFLGCNSKGGADFGWECQYDESTFSEAANCVDGVFYYLQKREALCMNVHNHVRSIDPLDDDDSSTPSTFSDNFAIYLSAELFTNTAFQADIEPVYSQQDPILPPSSACDAAKPLLTRLDLNNVCPSKPRSFACTPVEEVKPCCKTSKTDIDINDVRADGDAVIIIADKNGIDNLEDAIISAGNSGSSTGGSISAGVAAGVGVTTGGANILSRLFGSVTATAGAAAGVAAEGGL